MKSAVKRLAIALLGVFVLLVALFAPGLPWSPRCRHSLIRVIDRIEMKASAWQGCPPSLISLSGSVTTNDRALSGADVEALDSVSGWAALTDSQGRFVLPDLLWYPGASYTLVITANDYQVRTLRISAPAGFPEEGRLEAGVLQFDRAYKVDESQMVGRNSISYVEFDRANADYYRNLFDRLTANKQTDEDRLAAINEYVGSKLSTQQEIIATESPRSITRESPRQVLESGSRYCGKLALAVATVANAGRYQVRLVDVIDEMVQPSAHVVAEVYFQGKWHLYDPTAVGRSQTIDRQPKSYQELNVAVDAQPFEVADHLPMIHGASRNWLEKTYRSGFHHYYYFRN